MNDNNNPEGHNQPRSQALPQREGWDRDVLERLVFAAINEQRARRRWSVFFRFIVLGLVAFGLWMAFGPSRDSEEVLGPHTALIDIEGVIAAKTGGSAESVIPALNRAFSDSSSVGVILRVNSPGGSPVQAGMISDEIIRLRTKYPNKPLYVVVEDVCASGGYYIAASADKIFVNKASIVGSIGVLMDGFGFTGLMEKLGVERRLMTAGENKGFMDPFSPQSQSQKDYAQAMLDEIHRQFIEVVRQGRGERLKETPDTFSGLFWSGAQAVQAGLADGFGTVDSVARDELKAEEIVDYTQREALSERLLRQFGGAVGGGAMASMWGSTLQPALR